MQFLKDHQLNAMLFMSGICFVLAVLTLITKSLSPRRRRILAGVADAYDAMTSKRSYRDPVPQERVREEIVKGSGKQFDPHFAEIMLHQIDLDTDYTMKESWDNE